MDSPESDSLIESNKSSSKNSILTLSTFTEPRVRVNTRFFSRSTFVRITDFSTLPFWKKAIFLLIISLSCLVNVSCSSFFFPFYPNYAEDIKNVGPEIIGNQFGLLYFLVFIFCLTFGVFIKIIGPKFLYFCGYLILTVSMFLFAFIDRMVPILFAVYSFVLIITLAIGIAAVYTSSYSIGMALFPNHQNTVLAFIDTISGIGYVVSPIIGGALYDNTGWFWSWAVHSALALICTIIALIFLPLIKIESIQADSFSDYLNIFRLIPNVNILAVIIVNLVVTMCWSYQYNSLGPFLERTYGVSYVTIGYVMALPNLSYTILLPIVGIISERKGARIFILLSLPVHMVGLILTPPIYYIFQDRSRVPRPSVNTSIFPVPENNLTVNYIAITFFAQLLLGVGYTLAYGAMYVDMDKHVPQKLKKKLNNVPEILSSIRIATYFLANGVGPIVSGFLEPVLSFDDETLIFILALIATFLLFTPLSIWNMIYPKFLRKKIFQD
ncbi:MFS-type transporter SLC18B1-like [Oopsacas minuta]|uniref:MFS-type transporter SLC18B1-like n=1 Tax=Oopsacas minuta TaxID=111878 RepID=A0AAV7K150_9METZ|nr:MFS-type transporter SLC18B1-like [Oopsacas minuta]